MRSILRTIDRETVRDIALVCLADGIVGISFGAIAVGAGLPLWLPVVMSLVVFAGASQFLFVGVVAAGGSPFAAVAAALLVNARHFPFGLAVADATGSGWRRFVGAHLMTDENVAFALARPPGPARRAVYWACGVALFGCWNFGVLLGVAAGTAISDPAVLGLDAAFPAVLLALVLPALRERAVRTAALLGAVVAVAASTVAPPGIPVLLGLAALPLLRVVR